MCLAIGPTAVFNSDMCEFYATMDPASFHWNIIYLTDSNKIGVYGLDRVLLDKLSEPFYDYRNMNMVDSLEGRRSLL